MNQNGDEKRIRQLFLEMSSDDERRAPQFARILAAASSRTAGSKVRGFLRFAMAAAVLCAALLGARAVLVRPSESPLAETPGDQPSSTTVQPDAPQIADKPRVILAARAREPRRFIKRVHHRRTVDQTTVAMKSLFAWRSPTASLLETPADELMRSLPRLGESLQTIKSYSPDRFN